MRVQISPLPGVARAALAAPFEPQLDSGTADAPRVKTLLGTALLSKTKPSICGLVWTVLYAVSKMNWILRGIGR